MNKVDLTTIAAELKKTKKVIILTHENPDGDAIGSALALSKAMQANGSKVVVFSPDNPPSSFDFLDGFNDIKIASDPEVIELVRKGYRIIVVDGSSPNRCGISNFPPGSDPIVIDHHPTIEDYGQMVFVDTTKSSTAENIFHILNTAGMQIGLTISECLFTGIITDTGSFKYPNATSETFEITAQLLKSGMSTAKVSSMIYERMSYANRKLLGRAMERLSVSFGGKFAITAVTWKDMNEFEAELRDTDFIIDEIRKLGGCEIYVFAKEYRPDQFRISMRGRGMFDLSQLALKYGGGGHHDAAGFNATGDWLFVRANLLQIFESLFDNK